MEDEGCASISLDLFLYVSNILHDCRRHLFSYLEVATQ